MFLLYITREQILDTLPPGLRKKLKNIVQTISVLIVESVKGLTIKALPDCICYSYPHDLLCSSWQVYAANFCMTYFSSDGKPSE